MEFLDYVGDETLEAVLDLRCPPLAVDDLVHHGGIYAQLDHVRRHLRDLPGTPCRSLIIEREYVDRDHMADHGVFYALSLARYPNHCTRLHFFAIPRAKVQALMQEARRVAQEGGMQEYRRACDNLGKSYLGFSVIKPLGGCPVGRTVLRPYPESVASDTRRFPATRDYTVHVCGIALRAVGLAFQQQDLGVSACATTALWSSLQNASQYEAISAATPSQITKLASRYTLAFGRPMPSEGLSLDQMCMAVQSLGLAPSLLKLSSTAEARGILHAALLSGFAPVLILDKRQSDVRHAVTIVGMRTSPERSPQLLENPPRYDTASELISLYMHDDRKGPYLKGNLVDQRDHLGIELDLRGEGELESVEHWDATHVLIPLHPKIRLSYPDLRYIATGLIRRVQRLMITWQHRGYVNKADVEQVLSFGSRIMRAHKYSESLIASPGDLVIEEVDRFCIDQKLSRYVGVIGLESDFLGKFEVLVDTTSTRRNLKFLAFVCRTVPAAGIGRAIVTQLAKECDCESFG